MTAIERVPSASAHYQFTKHTKELLKNFAMVNPSVLAIFQGIIFPNLKII